MPKCGGRDEACFSRVSSEVELGSSPTLKSSGDNSLADSSPVDERACFLQDNGNPVCPVCLWHLRVKGFL